jgi:hypothetical protein
VISGEGSTEVGLAGVGSRGCCRVGSAEAGAQEVGRVGRPDCSPSSFCSGWSSTTTLLEVVWTISTTPGCSSGSLCLIRQRGVSTENWEPDLDGGGLVTGTFCADRCKDATRLNQSSTSGNVRRITQDLLPVSESNLAPTAAGAAVVFVLVPRNPRPLLLRGMRFDPVQQMCRRRSQWVLLSELSV